MIVAVLDTMWGWSGLEKRGTRYFRINPHNASGRRLYSLVGKESLWVTNVCKEVGADANQHGKPDADWLLSNLNFLSGMPERLELVLVCGQVAQEVFESLADAKRWPYLPTMCIDHPAARRWSKTRVEETREMIQRFVGHP